MFGAVAFSRIDSPPALTYSLKGEHICNGVMIVRGSALSVLRFDMMNIEIPTCYSTGKSLWINNMLYGYVDGVKRVEHLNH